MNARELGEESITKFRTGIAQVVRTAQDGMRAAEAAHCSCA